MIGVLLGKYRVLSKLGEGGMGVVYVGRHEALGHSVVVKVLQPDLSRDSEMVQRFFNEAQAATAIRNLGIVQVFDFGTTPDGSAYFVMELLEGQNLAARLKQQRLGHIECCRITSSSRPKQIAITRPVISSPPSSIIKQRGTASRSRGTPRVRSSSRATSRA